MSGDVRDMHWQRALAGALFQVASQFNLLEMIGPNKAPEDGVTIYQSDPTQGPACAMAAGAATIYRNYFAKVAGRLGQTKDRQIDALADLGESRECLLSRSAVRRVTAADELLSACGILVIKEQGLVHPYRASNPNSPWRTHSYFGDSALSSARGLREGGFPGTSKSILSWARTPEDRVSESLDHELA